MRLIKALTVRIASLNLPGKWRKDLDNENAKALYAELHAGRILPPIRIDRGRHVVQGFHRLAAAMEVGHKTIRADIVEYDSDQEREADQLAENLHRRVPDSEARRRGLARLVEIFAAEAGESSGIADGVARNFSAPAEEVPPKAKRGRPPEPKRQAIKKAAKLTGHSEDTVERAVKAQERDEEPAPLEPAPPPPPCIRSFGLPLPPSIDHRARQVQAAIDEIDKHLRAIAKIANGLEETGLSGHDAQKLAKDEYERFAFAARGYRPEALCPWCKGLAITPQWKSPCNGCNGTGFATAAKLRANVPEELLREGAEAMVAERGRMRPLRGEPSSPRRGLGGRELQITDPDGTPIEVPWEPSPGDLVLIEWDPGTAKRARFVRFTGPENLLVEVERVSPKGQPTGKFEAPRSFSRKSLLGAAPPEDLAF